MTQTGSGSALRVIREPPVQLAGRDDTLSGSDFVGRQFEGAHPYDALLGDKANPQYTQHVFRQFADNLRDDAAASSLLYVAYQKQVRHSLERVVADAVKAM